MTPVGFWLLFYVLVFYLAEETTALHDCIWLDALSSAFVRCRRSSRSEFLMHELSHGDGANVCLPALMLHLLRAGMGQMRKPV
jgi:hypothetical protein